MTHKKSYIIRAIGVVCSFSLLSSGFAQKVDEIVARHFEAIGGAERLKGIMSTRTVSIVSRFDGVGDVRTLMYAQRPHKIRVEYAFPQALVVMAYNGEIGWSQAILPNGKKLEPAVLSPEKTLTLLDDFDDVFDDSLFNFGAKGHRVDLVGRAQIMGHEAYELELTLKEGGKEHRFIDVGSMLAVTWKLSERSSNERPIPLTRYSLAILRHGTA
jgi:hypothetical protein